MSNVKNYTEQGGERTVIGGTLAIPAGGNDTLFQITAGTDSLAKTFRQQLAGVTVQAIENTSGMDLMVDRFAFRWVGTVANVTLDVGVNASPTTSADNLADDIVLAGTGTTRYARSNLDAPGTNGRAQAVWPAGHYLTLTNNGTNRAELEKVMAHITVTPLEA